MSRWFSEVYAWDELPVEWKDIRRIGADFLVDDSVHHQQAAERHGIAAAAYIVIPAYGSPQDRKDPNEWARLVMRKVESVEVAGMTTHSDHLQSPTGKRPSPRKPVLGLIGGIGSGKSLVAAELARRGGRIVSGDQAGHEALRQTDIRQQVVQRWGRSVLDEQGEIRRRSLGAIVFADAKERAALEGMVFPFILRRLREEIEAAQQDPAVKFVVLDAAIMLEAGWNNGCDRLVYIDTPRDVRLERLARSRGWSEEEVRAREAAQLPLEEKKRRADAVIDNAGTPEETARQIADLLARWGIA